MKDKEKLQGERITRARSYDQERFGLVDISGGEGRARKGKEGQGKQHASGPTGGA